MIAIRLLVAAALAASLAQDPDPLERVRWLAGCWEQRQDARAILEMWMPAEGGVMLGASRTVAAGVTREFEHLRLSVADGRLAYTALPSRQRETTFHSVEVSDSGFAVENRAHDFPQRIEYRRRGADSLLARVEGPGPNGPRGFTIAMRRVPCTAP